MTVLDTMTPVQVPDLLELETTGFCNLACGHCYASSGIHGNTGTMTAADWERVIRQAAALGVHAAQFIGGSLCLPAVSLSLESTGAGRRRAMGAPAPGTL